MFRAAPCQFLLGILDVINPELVLGFANLDIITKDPEMKAMLEADKLRWTGGCKVNAIVRDC